jgi:hypothetical protein
MPVQTPHILSRAIDLMTPYPAPWWIAGGWAIDLFLGEVSRPHEDVDIATLRRDQEALRNHLAGWSLRKAAHSTLEMWQPGETLELPLHEVHAEKDGVELEFLLNEADGDKWLYRRDQAISTPLGTLTHRTESGVPYLCPEVVLLFKSKAPRRVDQEDFRRTVPLLTTQARNWLADAVSKEYPNHEWLPKLGKC